MNITSKFEYNILFRLLELVHDKSSSVGKYSLKRFPDS